MIQMNRNPYDSFRGGNTTQMGQPGVPGQPGGMTAQQPAYSNPYSAMASNGTGMTSKLNASPMGGMQGSDAPMPSGAQGYMGAMQSSPAPQNSLGPMQQNSLGPTSGGAMGAQSQGARFGLGAMPVAQPQSAGRRMQNYGGSSNGTMPRSWRSQGQMATQ